MIDWLQKNTLSVSSLLFGPSDPGVKAGVLFCPITRRGKAMKVKIIKMEGQRYCKSCHAAYMRKWRKTHPLKGEAKLKDKCRSYAYTYYKRGHLTKSPCQICGDPKSQMHHDDYSKPLQVKWFCRKCHLKYHREILNAPQLAENS
jgi:hypothetical protein